MSVFTDDEGRVWHPRIDAFALLRVQEETGRSIFQEAASAKRTAELFTDLKVFFTLLFVSVRKEATEREVNREGFLEAIQSSDTFNRATDALLEAFSDFFQAKPKSAPPPEVDEPSPGAGETSTS